MVIRSECDREDGLGQTYVNCIGEGKINVYSTFSETLIEEMVA